MENYLIAGFDEVGRGALAGPLVVCLCFLNNQFPIHTKWYNPDEWQIINSIVIDKFGSTRDSKKHNRSHHKFVLDSVTDLNIKHTLLTASNNLIDKFGIGQCLSHLFVLSLASNQKLIGENCKILVDGYIKLNQNWNYQLMFELCNENCLDYAPIESWILPIKQINMEPKSDDIFLSVAIASNLAKFHRDSIMIKLDQTYPEFGWDQNKGYGTLKHRKKITQNLYNPFLRQSFLSNIRKSLKDE